MATARMLFASSPHERLLGTGGKGMHVGDDEEALVAVLQLDTVLDAAHVMPDVQRSGGPVAGEDARPSAHLERFRSGGFGADAEATVAVAELLMARLQSNDAAAPGQTSRARLGLDYPLIPIASL